MLRVSVQMLAFVEAVGNAMGSYATCALGVTSHYLDLRFRITWSCIMLVRWSNLRAQFISRWATWINPSLLLQHCRPIYTRGHIWYTFATPTVTVTVTWTLWTNSKLKCVPFYWTSFWILRNLILASPEPTDYAMPSERHTLTQSLGIEGFHTYLRQSILPNQ